MQQSSGVYFSRFINEEDFSSWIRLSLYMDEKHKQLHKWIKMWK